MRAIAGVVDEPVSLRTGLRSILRVPAAVAAVLTVMAVNFALSVVGVTLLPLTLDSWGAGEPEFGFGTAALGVGSLATPLLARLVRGRTAHRAASVAAGLPLAAVLVAPSWASGLLPLAAFGAGATLVECETTRVLQEQAPPRYRALALGIADTAMMAAALAGAALAPWLSGLLGPLALVGCLAVLVAAASWFGLSVRPVRARTGTPVSSGT